jgi:predicted transcriptional regulator
MSMENIAECLGITDDTLRKHFRYEIVTSRAVIKGKAIGVINDALTDGSVDAAKFVLSRIAGWTEKQDHTIGGELDHKHVHRIERVIIKANGANDPDSNG